jgi:hypothetical protein
LLRIPSTTLVALRDSFEFVSDTDCERWELPAPKKSFGVTEKKGLSRSQRFSELDIYSRALDPFFRKAVVHFNLRLLSAPSLTSEDTPWQSPGVPFRLHKAHGPRVRPRKFVGAQEFRKEKRMQRKRPRHHDSSQELKRSKRKGGFFSGKHDSHSRRPALLGRLQPKGTTVPRLIRDRHHPAHLRVHRQGELSRLPTTQRTTMFSVSSGSAAFSRCFFPPLLGRPVRRQ